MTNISNNSKHYLAPLIRAAPAGEEHVRPVGRIIAHPERLVLKALQQQIWREIQSLNLKWREIRMLAHQCGGVRAAAVLAAAPHDARLAAAAPASPTAAAATARFCKRFKDRGC